MRENVVDFRFRGRAGELVAAGRQSETALRGVRKEAERTGAGGSKAMAGFTYGLNRMAQSITSARGTVGSAVTGMLGSLAGLAAKGALAFGALGAAGVGLAGVMGLNFLKIKEQATIAFTTMLHSGQKAQDFLTQLQTFAAHSPFDFPGVVQASQRMLAMGFAAKEVIPDLTAISDAVAGLGQGTETLTSVTLALGQMRNAGRVNAQDMNQLTQAGINGWKYLAEAAGKSIGEVRAMSEKGMLNSREAVQVILAGMSKDFGGMTEKQAHTFAGLWSTIKDTVSMTAGTAMKPLFDLMENGMQKLVDFTSTPQWTAGVKGLTEWIQSRLVPAVVSFVNYLVNNRGAIFGAFKDGASFALTMGKAVLSIIPYVQKVVGWMGGLKNSIGLLVGAWASARLAGIAFGIAMQVMAVTTAGVMKTALISTGIGAIVVAAGIAATLIIEHWDAVKAFFIKLGNIIKGLWENVWHNVAEAAKGAVYVMLQTFTAGLQFMLKAASHLPFGVGDAAKKALGELTGFIDKFKPQFETSLRDTGKAAGNALGKGLYDATLPWITSVSSAITGAGGASVDMPMSAGAMGKASTAVTAALSMRNTPYSFGGGHGGSPGPSAGSSGIGLDCSGLIRAAYAKAGINVGGTAAQLAKTGVAISIVQIQPGDIIVTRGGQHVVMYVGNSEVVAASSVSHKVVTQPLSWHIKGSYVVRRIVPEKEAGATDKADKAAAAVATPEPTALTPPGDLLQDAKGTGTGTTKAAKAPPTGDKLIPKGLRLSLAKASITKQNADDLAVLRDIETYLKERIRHEKDNAALIDELDTIQGKIEPLQTQADQGFRAQRGLSAVLRDVEKVVAPRLRVTLRKQAQEISDALKKVVTPADMDQVSNRLEKLKQRLADGLALNKGIKSLRGNLNDVAEAVARMPEDARKKMLPNLAKLRNQLTNVVTSSNLDAVRSKLDQIRAAVAATIEKARAEVERRSASVSSAFQKVSDKVFRVFDAATDKLLANARIKFNGFDLGEGDETPAEAAVRQFRDARAATDREKQRLALQDRIANAQTPEDKAAAEEELMGMTLDDQERALQDAADIERKAVDKALADERQRITDERGLVRERFQARYDEIVAGFQNEEITATTAQSRVIALMNEYGVDFTSAGQFLGASFVDGFKDAMQALADTVNALVASINTLRGEQGLGPVSGLTLPSVGQLVATPGGVAGGSYYGVLSPQNPTQFAGGGWLWGGRKYTGGPQTSTDSLQATVRAGEMVMTPQQLIETAHAVGGGGGPTFHITIPGAVLLGNDREIAERLADLLEPAIRRRVSF